MSLDAFITPPLVCTLVAAEGFDLSPFIPTDLAAVPGSPLRMQILVAGRAIDFYYAQQDSSLLQAMWRDFLQAHPVDIFVQHTASRTKKLFIADMESTIIEQEMLDELADCLGLRDKVAAITRRAMNGELDFAAALHERVALLAGKPAELLDQVAARITLMPGAEALLRTLKAAGVSCWLVTGGFSCFAAGIAQRLGFDRYYANELVVCDGVISGGVLTPLLDKESKRKFLEAACDEAHCGLAASLAVGDGANDIPMLEACARGSGLGVAYRAKPAVRAAITNQINHGDLSALIYALGLLPHSND